MTTTPVPPPVALTIPAVSGGTKPLTDPPGVGHAALHDQLRDAVMGLNGRVNDLSTLAGEAQGDIEQARLSPFMLSVPGPLAVTGKVLLPVIWNITGRDVLFEASRITVVTPPIGADLVVDVLVSESPQPGAGAVSFDPTTMTVAATLTIAEGQNVSAVATDDNDDFGNRVHAQNTFVSAIITQVGSTNPGADLTVQINRNL